MGKPEEELFEIRLEGMERELNVELGGETLEVEFSVSRSEVHGHVTISMGAETVTTTEIVPLAMSDLHRAFATLADQTKGWRIERV